MPLSTEQQRLVSMLDYLEEWDKLNRSPTFDVNSHQGGFLAWQSDIEQLPGVSLNTCDATGEVWLELERLRTNKPPLPSEKLVPWIVLRDDPSTPPTTRETLPNPDEPEKPFVFETLPHLSAAFDAYIGGPWKKWAENEKPRRKTMGFYDRLFNLLQAIETEGAETALELVWGVGVALWNHNGKRVRHPLISCLVEIDPVSIDMALRVRPREVPPILETDVFVALEVAGLPVFEKAAHAILDHPECHVSPFDEASFEQILTGAAGNLDKQARYWPREADFEPGKLPTTSNELTVTNSWVLFARRKGTNFLIEDIRRLKAAVESGPVPDGAPKILVETLEGAMPERRSRSWRGLSNAGGFANGQSSRTSNATRSAESRELYFPLPFNSEQVQIIDKLEHANGVVVQGPPGTGKTHTIANVICHYLAEGKRVLVTSKGESALTVLRDYLPEAIKSLTVSLLTNEREGLNQLELSVRKITTDITNQNESEIRQSIEETQRKIDLLHERISSIDRELADWARKNITPAPPGLDGLRPAELARHVADSQAVYGWFPDNLHAGPEHELNFDPAEMEHLCKSRRTVAQDLKYLYQPTPQPDSLPTPAQMADLHQALRELESVRAEIDETGLPRLKGSTPQHVKEASELRDVLLDAAKLRRRLDAGWAAWLREQFAREQRSPVFEVAWHLCHEWKALIDSRQQFLGMAIEWQEEWDGDDELYEAIKRATAGKSPFGIVSFGKKEPKERFQKIRLNNKAPNGNGDWQWIETHVVIRRNSRTLVARWNALSGECPAPPLPHSPLESIKAAQVLLEHLNDAQRWTTEVSCNLAERIVTVFANVPADGLGDEPERMDSLAYAIAVRLKRQRLESAKGELARLQGVFSTSKLPVFCKATEFLSAELGATTDGIKVEERWREILSELDRLRMLEPHMETIHRVTNLIEKSGAKTWAQNLRTLHPTPDNADELIPNSWAAAWKWSRQAGYLNAIDGREKVQAMSAKRLTEQHDLSNAYARLIELLTWLKLRKTLDQDRGLMSSLQQYMAAIRGIGAGTGVRAVRYRHDARKAMMRANRAIRCWIMPHWRVSESLPSELALFDLVIIDEASQSDLWALPALLRAKKLLVVGDNKQVSPSAVGVKESDIRQLHSRFLRTLPFGDVLTPEKSIYDLASVMFASDLVRLREHFRCVEPIIEFSNKLSYNGEIRCLRVPNALERINPPLVDVFVKSGQRTARTIKTNRIEAQAIVDEIKRLSADPAYAKRSIGVVSLLGSDQAKMIFELLIQEVGEEVIVRHKIRCGDAMTFQGREADIVFISMVTDANSLKALSGEMYEQRFNVAASRAKDRLYLYRSFRREDLSENDLRAKLLDHFASPLRRDPEKKGRERCESDFERDVYDRLTALNYRVTPQVPAGGYRIDMVVEGAQGNRLAIECDGDQYHTPDVWMKDLHRQRVLERAGWTFWRCWGSSFIRDAEACMTDLVAKLKGMGIQAIGASAIDLTDVVEYREVGIDEAEQIDVPVTVESPAPIELESKTPVELAAQAPTRNNTPTLERQSELLPLESDLPLFAQAAPVVTNVVEAGDSVRFVFLDEDDEAYVSISSFQSNPDLGFINTSTPIAKALLGNAVGAVINCVLPMGTRCIRIISIEKQNATGP